MTPPAGAFQGEQGRVSGLILGTAFVIAFDVLMVSVTLY